MPLLGFFVGAIIAVLLLSRLIEWAVMKRLVDDPVVGKVGSVAAAWLVASIIYGFGAADGGPFVTNGFFTYGFAAIIVGFFAHRKGVALRDERADEGYYSA